MRLDQKLELRQHVFELDEVLLGPGRPDVTVRLANDHHGRLCVSLRRAGRGVNIWINPNGELTIAQEIGSTTLYLQENVDGTNKRFLPDRPYAGTGRQFTTLQTGLNQALFDDDGVDDPVRRMLGHVPRAPRRAPSGSKGVPSV